MKRGTLVITVCLAALSAMIISGHLESHSAWAVELKLSHFMAPMHIQHQKSFTPFAEKVAELSGGEVTIKIFPGGQLGGPKQAYDIIANGITDIGFFIPSYETARFPRSSVMELPFLFETGAQQTKVAYELFDKYFADDFKEVKILWIYSSGPGVFMTNPKPVLTVEDLKGVKMRAPNALMTQCFKIMGANPVGMPITEVNISLEKGIIDGLLTPINAIDDFRLYDLVKYVSKSNMYATIMMVGMNKQAFASLSDKGKKAIEDAATMTWGLHASEVYLRHDQKTIENINQQGKIKIFDVAPAELTKMVRAVAGVSQDWIETTAKRNVPAKEILEAVRTSAQKNKDQ